MDHDINYAYDYVIRKQYDQYLEDDIEIDQQVKIKSISTT